jgi:hypothetical protein
MMKFTTTAFTQRALSVSILAASLTLPFYANAAGAELSAGISTDAVSTVTKTTKHLKHTVGAKKDAAVNTVSQATTSTTETVAPAAAAASGNSSAPVSIDSSAGISASPSGASLGGSASTSVTP